MFRIAAAAVMLLIAMPVEDASAEDRGAVVFEQACTARHLESMSAAETDQAEDLAAPPMNLLSTIIRRKTGNTQSAFVAHVVDFTRQPAEDKVLAMAEALDRFGLMPPIREIDPSIKEDDLRAVAAWLFGHYDYEYELQELLEHQGSAGQ